ncbi:thiamine pyrophosphate-dependent enzyme [Dethiosulfatarculus sandiegensis]|uniref:2-oxoglutarate synthase n=1 Tax=Dethiosulfatarculus sandiegensis TaxID=1429043 RepID=A0A0D2JUV1_9BACT|nr:thiamine pyrophosphate-dependent enzyme [Dethiosulfatarculus sandiegensis]KIX13320.1 2-oxoglutarate synthase [Dethiosulfatarculus sandiegensis]
MHPLAEKYLRKSALPTIYCPGCGHGTVLNAFVRAIDELAIGDELALVGGIGCSGWTPVFIKSDVLHTLHGRALAMATGLKLARPDRKVVVFTGDGDCLAIGGNHFMHAARRNLDLTVVMMNNNIYGMTGGQTAPSTPYGAITQTSPHGNPEPAFDACELARSFGASFIARWTSAHPLGLKKSLKQAMVHQGFSFVEVMVQCPTQAGRYMHGTSDALELMQMLKKKAIPVKKADQKSPEELKGRFTVGKLLERNGLPEFSRTQYDLMQRASKEPRA